MQTRRLHCTLTPICSSQEAWEALQALELQAAPYYSDPPNHHIGCPEDLRKVKGGAANLLSVSVLVDDN